MQSSTPTPLYPQHRQPDYPGIDREILEFWEREGIFQESVDNREGAESFTFYEGPPSANGMPGIHHVMARAIKDLFCRYHTLRGKQVKRKAGWDTHGLPIELQVEKSLGITKKDIGVTISVEEYNRRCREDVMKFKHVWDELTVKMGYWVDLEHPYVTFENDYIESVWWVLKQLWDKGLLYKGYSIQPYSPAAGTGLSSHELNQPGAYREVKDTSVVAMFKVTTPGPHEGAHILAWTTTPWTLPANSALAVGANISYEKARTLNPFTGEHVDVIYAAARREYVFHADTLKGIAKHAGEAAPYTVLGEVKGSDLVGLSYARLLQFELPKLSAPAFTVLAGDFVTTEDGTGIVHMAGTFGADDYRLLNRLEVPIVYVKRYILVKEGEQVESQLTEQEFDNYFSQLFTSFVEKVFENEESFSSYYWEHKSRSNSPIDNYLTFPSDDFSYLSSRFESLIADKFPESIETSKLNDFVKYLHLRFKRPDNHLEYVPIVDRSGKYVKELGENFAYKYVKNYTDAVDYYDVDVELVKKLKLEGKAWRSERFEHNYPHCWRTDKPVLYYPLDSWFIATSKPEVKQRLIDLNKTINWKPASTGTGRFGNWLENLEDWNLSRSRYWGIPLNVWRPMRIAEMFAERYDRKGFLDHIVPNSKQSLIEVQQTEFGTVTPYELFAYDSSKHRIALSRNDYLRRKLNIDAINESVAVQVLIENGLRNEFPCLRVINPEDIKDLHKPYIDYICFVHDHAPPSASSNVIDVGFDGRIISEQPEEPRAGSGSRILELYVRESDLIDVWFDSGAMPYAQWHYPFENKDIFEKSFPADFIAEGVDQTRGWFFTLHAIAGMLLDKVAFKNVISNGLVLDKSGNKMSKRLGNAVDPFETLNAYGADATRWYLIENAPPWENLKFNLEHLHESQRRFFGTLFNTYQFFALYANIDGWRVEQFDRVPREQLTELDRWIVSRVYTLVNECTAAYDDYDPTRAARAIESFVVNELSNWYVRLCRRRFWKGTMTTDKRAAYETLQHCLVAVAQLISPIAPFFADWLYRNLTEAVREESITRNTPFRHASVHLTDWHPYQPEWVDADLEARMQLAMDLCSLGHAIRKREKIKVRQPLATLLVAVAGEGLEQRKAAVKLIEPILQSELNVKAVEVIAGDSGVIAKSAKANFKVLGKRYGAQMQLVAKAIEGFSTAQITALEAGTTLSLPLDGTGETFEVALGDIEVRTQVTSGLAVASAGSLTIALDVKLTPSLEREGLARELVNRIQNLRKDSGFEVTDVISVLVEAGIGWDEAVTEYAEYIRAEVLARQLELVPRLDKGVALELESRTGRIHITRL